MGDDLVGHPSPDIAVVVHHGDVGQREPTRTQVHRGAVAGVVVAGRTQRGLTGLQGSQDALEARLGDVDGLVPGEPAHLLALAHTGCRCHIGSVQQVAQIEVDVLARPRVDVDVDQLRAAGRKADVEAGLLVRLAERGVPRGLARLDVPAGLQPDAESLVAMQHDAPFADNDRAAGDVHAVGVFAERLLQHVEMLDKCRQRRTFSVVDRATAHDLVADRRDERGMILGCGFGHRCDDTVRFGRDRTWCSSWPFPHSEHPCGHAVSKSPL